MSQEVNNPPGESPDPVILTEESLPGSESSPDPTEGTDFPKITRIDLSDEQLQAVVSAAMTGQELDFERLDFTVDELDTFVGQMEVEAETRIDGTFWDRTLSLAIWAAKQILVAVK